MTDTPDPSPATHGDPVAVEVTDHIGEQIRLRPLPPPHAHGEVAAVEYRHDGEDHWVPVVSVTTDDLARLREFVAMLLFAAGPGEAAAELRELLYAGAVRRATGQGSPSAGLFQAAPAWERWRDPSSTPPGGVGPLDVARALRYVSGRYGRPADDVIFGPRDRFPGQLDDVTDRPVNLDALNDLARGALMRVLAEAGTAVHHAIGNLTACGEYLTGKVITRTGIRDRVTCASCAELAEFGGNPAAGPGVVHAIGPDGALRGGCTMRVGDEAATTWNDGADRVTCPACRAALVGAQPQDVHLRSVAPIVPPPTPPAGMHVVVVPSSEDPPVVHLLRFGGEGVVCGASLPEGGVGVMDRKRVTCPGCLAGEDDDGPWAPPLTHWRGDADETACGIHLADEPTGLALAADRAGVSCSACLAATR